MSIDLRPSRCKYQISIKKKVFFSYSEEKKGDLSHSITKQIISENSKQFENIEIIIDCLMTFSTLLIVMCYALTSE